MSSVQSPKKPNHFADPFQLRPAVVRFAGEEEFTPPSEKERIEALNRIVENPELPTPPALALEIIKKANNPNCSIEDIRKLVCLDSGLSARLLKTINSALFGLARAVTSIDLALNLMGIKQFRSLVLGLSLPSMQSKDTDAKRKADYWKASVAGAVVCREMALFLGRPEPEDHLIAGLLRDMGEIVLERLYPKAYEQITAGAEDLLAVGQCKVENRLLNTNHAEVSAYLLEKWGMPEDICEPIRYHHAPHLIKSKDSKIIDRARILYFATRTAQFILHPENDELGRQVVQLAQDLFSIPADKLRAVLDPMHKKTMEFAQLLKVDIGTCDGYYRLVAQAVDELVTSNLKAALCDSADRDAEDRSEAERLRAMAQKLQPDVPYDLLTGVFHRGSFDTLLTRQFRQARRAGRLLGLVVLDLRHFKTFNRQHGHQDGDRVLKDLANRLRKETRPGEVLARWGGDQFCLALPHVQHATLQIRIDELRKAFAEFRLGLPEGTELNAVFVGLLAFPRPGQITLHRLLEAVEPALRQVKQPGSPNSGIVSLLTPEEQLLFDEIQRQRLVTFLLDRKLVSVEALRDLPPLPGGNLGRWLRKQRWLKPRRIKQLVADLRGHRKPWLPVLRACLSLPQIAAVLAARQEHPEKILQELTRRGILDAAQAKKVQSDYFRFLGN